MPLSCTVGVGGGECWNNRTPVVDRLLDCCNSIFHLHLLSSDTLHLDTIYQINRLIIYNFQCIDWAVEIRLSELLFKKNYSSQCSSLRQSSSQCTEVSEKADETVLKLLNTFEISLLSPQECNANW